MPGRGGAAAARVALVAILVAACAAACATAAKLPTSTEPWTPEEAMAEPRCPDLEQRCGVNVNATHPMIYGIMITGKDGAHEFLAFQAVRSFFGQTYPNLALIIVNDGNYTLKDMNSKCICEIRVMKQKGVFLGQLRNVALRQVPRGSVWVQIDDDDWRRPSCLEGQLRYMREQQADMVYLRAQVQFKLDVNSSRQAVWDEGFMGTIMANTSKEPIAAMVIPNLVKEEDLHYSKVAATPGIKLSIWDNPPREYVRLIHGHNTWDDEHFGLQWKPDTWCATKYQAIKKWPIYPDWPCEDEMLVTVGHVRRIYAKFLILRAEYARLHPKPSTTSTAAAAAAAAKTTTPGPANQTKPKSSGLAGKS